MEEAKRENAKEIEIRGEISLDEVVNTLNSLNMISRKPFFVIFNGVRLDSTDNLTIDDAYLRVYGDTRSETFRKSDETKRKKHEVRDEAMETAKNNIPKRFEEGKKYLYPERVEEWKDWLEFWARNSNDSEIEKHPDLIIECLKRLENGEDFEAVFEFVKENSKEEAVSVASTLLDFSKVGPEYFEYAYKKKNGEELPKGLLEMVEAKKEENRKLAERHKVEREVSTSEVREIAEEVTIGSATRAMEAATGQNDKEQKLGPKSTDEQSQDR